MLERSSAVLLLFTLGAAPAAAAGSDPHGFVPEAVVRARARDYLRFATRDLARGSILNAIAHMERDAADPRYRAPRGAVDVDDWNAAWAKLDRLEDTRDFEGLYLLNALLGYEGHPYLTPALWERIRVALLSFKMWFIDPTPPQPDPAEPGRDWDDSFYWTENHQLLYHVIEYLAGQRFPDECFWIVGFERTSDCTGPGELRGAAHVARARGFLLRWMEERWEAGFSEWLSNVYYQKDATPLLTLVEYAEDPELATRAAILLDVLLLDVATHTHRNVFAATHGRSYMKDKYRGPEDDTWGLSVLLFGRQGRTGFTSVGDPGATLFARARSYRLPGAILEAARARRPHVVRTRQGFPLDPSAPVEPDPEHPPGHSFEDTEANFTFWWGLGAYTAWQVVPLTVLNGDRWNLWNTDLLRGFRTLRDILGEPPSLEFGQFFASLIAPLVNAGLLAEANTYTYRTPDYVLSTVQDHRRGENAGQVQAWQATFDEDALVFTTHAMNPVQPPSEWIGRDEGSPGYWTGTASMPRSAQHENVAIHLYSPAYADGGLLGFFDYEQTTHAYFPQDHFDEVVQAGGWTFGRKGKGYVALWSWGTTFWQDYTPDELARPANGPLTRSFDLVAPEGASNVWIVECGRQADWRSFDAFRSAILAARVEVTPYPAEFGFAFDVVYDSPSQGLVSFGWDAPLFVRGQVVPIGGYPRADHPWVTAERGDRAWAIEGRRSRVLLDWDAPSREVLRRGPAAGGKGARAVGGSGTPLS
jgi:hypothetical protein